MKGIVDEDENVSVIYINDKAATKYAKAAEAKTDADKLRAKFPNKKIEVKQEVRGGMGGNEKLKETEAIKGAEGKRCWKGKRFAGTKNGKDKCIPVSESDGDNYQEIGRQLHEYAQEIKELTDAAMQLVRGTPEEGRAKAYWYPHIVMALGDDHGYMGKNMATMSQSAESLMGGGDEEIDEASGTPGGVEMYRTPSMINTTMQQNLYKRDLKAVNDAEKKEKEAAYRKANPREAVPMMTIGAGSYQIPVIQAWIDNNDVGQAIKYAVNKFANKQSTEFKTELASDPTFKEAVINFFNVGADALAARNELMSIRRVKVPDTDYRTKEQTKAGFAAANRINDVLLGYMKKFGVDKTGRRVPSDFKYNLEEAREVTPALRAAQKNLVDLSTGEVRKREEAKRAAEKRRREYDKQYNQKPKKPTLDQIWQKVEHAISNYFPDGDPADYLNPYMQKTGITWDDITRAAKKNGYKDLWDYWNTLAQDIENDAYSDWHATGGKAVRTRAPFMEEESVDEDTSYAGGMGQGGNAGQSYRKFKPKSAGTFRKRDV